MHETTSKQVRYQFGNVQMMMLFAKVVVLLVVFWTTQRSSKVGLLFTAFLVLLKVNLCRRKHVCLKALSWYKVHKRLSI